MTLLMKTARTSPASLPCLLAAAACLLGGNVLRADAPFEPWKTSPDPVAKMWERVAKGTAKIDLSSPKAWVRSVLKELKVPEETQVLVFSKTSLQNALISPQTPRSVFFSEDVYAGWSQGGMMELMGMVPGGEPEFYTLAYPYDKGDKLALESSDKCTSCHESSRTEGVKGVLVRSVYVDTDGQPLLQFGSYLSGHESPLGERWGGWYVTGRHGKDVHMGNVLTKIEGDRPVLDYAQGSNVTSLDRFFSTGNYIAPTSDIVALMVLEHQCSMHNKLTNAGKSAREAMARQHDLQKAFNEPITDVPQGSALTVIKSHAEKVVKHMLFCEEYPLKDGGVEGGAVFQDAFRKDRRETADGRSLKDFQLLNRLFKYRCSYMIYSKAFDLLPPQMKTEVYRQLWSVLSGANQSKDFAHLGAQERQHIVEILRETKKDLPAEWKGNVKLQASNTK